MASPPAPAVPIPLLLASAPLDLWAAAWGGGGASPPLSGFGGRRPSSPTFQPISEQQHGVWHIHTHLCSTPSPRRAHQHAGSSGSFGCGGSCLVRITMGLFTSSITLFHVDVRALITMTLSGHPWRIPFVAFHHAPKHPPILQTRYSWLYIPWKALRTPFSIPWMSSIAIDMARVYGLEVGWLVWVLCGAGCARVWIVGCVDACVCVCVCVRVCLCMYVCVSM